MISTLVFFLEERSAQVLLEGLLPRILPSDIQVLYQVFEGKQDLEKNLTRRLRAWQRPDSGFVVLRDQDSADCATVKSRLVERVQASGRNALVRVACRELEAWVAGDLERLAEEYDVPAAGRTSTKAKFRDPDALGDPVGELKRLVPGYMKVDGARRMGLLLDPSRNASCSFRVFCSGLTSLLE